MQAINCKDVEAIKMFLEEVSADMSIIEYNIREEVNCSEDKKNEYAKMVRELGDNIYNIAKQFHG